MKNGFWVSDEQFSLIQPYLPYRASDRRRKNDRRKIRPVISNKSNRKHPYPFNRKRYRGRNVVERMFGRLKDFRKVASRYDKTVENFLAGLCLAA